MKEACFQDFRASRSSLLHFISYGGELFEGNLVAETVCLETLFETLSLFRLLLDTGPGFLLEEIEESRKKLRINVLLLIYFLGVDVPTPSLHLFLTHIVNSLKEYSASVLSSADVDESLNIFKKIFDENTNKQQIVSLTADLQKFNRMSFAQSRRLLEKLSTQNLLIIRSLLLNP